MQNDPRADYESCAHFVQSEVTLYWRKDERGRPRDGLNTGSSGHVGSKSFNGLPLIFQRNKSDGPDVGYHFFFTGEIRRELIVVLDLQVKADSRT